MHVIERSEHPLVSVVIPVHNGRGYLAECLDSVLAQTLESVEIIVVDDASSDGTAVILDHYVQMGDGRVRVLTQQTNQGVSAARNRGIDAARGAFVAFVDADDVVRPRMYEHLLEVAEARCLDVVSCGIQLFDGEGRLSQTIPYPMQSGAVYDTGEVRALLESGFTSKLLWFPVRSLYRRSLIEAHDVRFDTRIRKGEDSLFNLELLTRASRCAAVEDAYYLYRKHAASVTARPLPSESENLEVLADRVTQFARGQGLPNAVIDDFYRYILSSDLPSALIRVAGVSSSRRELQKLRSSQHVRTALEDWGRLQPQLPLRVRLLLLLYKYVPTSLVNAALSARRGVLRLRRTSSRRSRKRT